MQIPRIHVLALTALMFALCGVTPLVAAAAQEATELETLEHQVQMNPTDVAARLRLAGSYEAQGRLDQAIEQYEAVVRMTEPASKEGGEARRRLRYAVATRHAQRGEIDQALPIFEELAAEYPDNPVIVYSVGVAHLIKREMPEARAAFEKVIALDPKFAGAYLNLATVEEAQGQMSEAVAHLQKVIDIDPKSASARQAEVRLNVIEGQILANEGNLADAIAAFQKVIETDPRNQVALSNLVELYRRTGNGDAEFATLQEIVSAYPDNWGMRLRLAEIYIANERIRDAYQQLEPVLDLGPASPFAGHAQDLFDQIRNTEVVRRIENQKSQARITALKAKLSEHPDDVAAWKELGLLQYRRGDYTDAAQAFAEAKRLDPKDLQSRYGLAAVYDNLGRFADSMEEYAVLISLESDDRVIERLVPALLLVNAKNLYVKRKYPDAIREFSQILATNPNNGIAHFYLGLIYSREDEMARAVDAYREAIRLAPGNISARLSLASTYERLNREEDAIDEYSKILQANPPKEIADTARQGLVNAQRRLRGFSASLGYLMAFDTNSNLSHSDPQEDLRSDLSFNLNYQYKMENNLRWRFQFAPVYSTYHNEGFDYLNTTTTISAGVMPGSYSLVGGFTNRISDGLVSNSRLGRMNTLFGDLATRTRLPAFFNPLGKDRVVSSLSFDASYSDFDAKSAPFFSAYVSALSVSLSQPVSDRQIWRAGYQFVVNSNKELVGNDYAYRDHGISLGMDYLMPWGVINAGYALDYYYYTNADSFSGFTRHRSNLRNNLAVGASWRWRRDISLFATLSWTHNDSNLPVGFVLSSQDIVEALQSSSLSDYSRLMLTTGITLNF